jgi:hypothetical protein
LAYGRLEGNHGNLDRRRGGGGLGGGALRKTPGKQENKYNATLHLNGQLLLN